MQGDWACMVGNCHVLLCSSVVGHPAVFKCLGGVFKCRWVGDLAQLSGDTGANSSYWFPNSTTWRCPYSAVQKGVWSLLCVWISGLIA